MAWSDSHDYTVGDMRQLTHDGLLGDDQAPAPENQVTLSEPGKLSAEFLAAIARSKGRQPAKDIAEVNASQEILAVSAQMNNTQNMDKTPAPVVVPAGGSYQIGQLVADKGVYFGTTTLHLEEDKTPFDKIFNLFAAPYDLGFDEHGKGQRLVSTYDDAVKNMASIRDYMGHKGSTFKTRSDFLKAITKNTYQGEWFVPTLMQLIGRSESWQKWPCDNLGKHKDKGALKNSFATLSSSDSGIYHYWSSTEDTVGYAEDEDMPQSFLLGRMDTAEPHAMFNEGEKALTRLVRLEPL